MSLNFTEDVPKEFYRKMSEDISDNMDFEDLLEAEFGSMNSPSMDELFSEALETMAVAREKVDHMLPAGVSPSIPVVVEITTRALAAKGKGGREE